MMKNIITAKNKTHLKKLIEQEMILHGDHCDLNHLDVSNITDMNNLFSYSSFSGDISNWDVAKVTDMGGMFQSSKFNGDISAWDVSKVQNMNAMFYKSKFNEDISNWDVSNVTTMMSMFSESIFNGDLEAWKPYNLNDCYETLKDWPATPPYWLNIENQEERVKAIDSYALSVQLQENLFPKPLSTKKIKI